MKKQILKIALVFTIATILIFSLKYAIEQYHKIDAMSLCFGIIAAYVLDLAVNFCKNK